MRAVARNDWCPCGSGRKYKRCCLNSHDAAARDRREGERVWDRMQGWAFDHFAEELDPALLEHLGGRGVGTTERPADENDLAVALGWLLIDRRLAGGDTPARLYAGLAELAPGERGMAERIAASRLGAHRVTDAEPGAWIELEDVLNGARIRVDSPNVSVVARRWHVLLCRVQRGGPVPSLWGGAAFYEPHEEVEIMAELRRIALANGLGTDRSGLEAAFTVGARELVCFMPPSRRVKPTFHTVEGDRVAVGEATWRLADPAAALRALLRSPELTCLGEHEEDDALVFDWVAGRRELLAQRPALPEGAVVLDGGPVAVDERGEVRGGDATSLGTFILRGDVLELSCLSPPRLEAGVALVERSLGRLATELRRDLRSLDQVLERGQAGPGGRRRREASDPGRGGSGGADPARLRALVFRRWMDDPHPLLGGLSPRQAATRPEHREELERQLRLLEHQDAKHRHDRVPGPDLARMRRQLGLDHQLAAR